MFSNVASIKSTGYLLNGKFLIQMPPCSDNIQYPDSYMCIYHVIIGRKLET